MNTAVKNSLYEIIDHVDLAIIDLIEALNKVHELSNATEDYTYEEVRQSLELTLDFNLTTVRSLLLDQLKQVKP